MQRENRLDVSASLECFDALPALEYRRKVEKVALLLVADTKPDHHSNSLGIPRGAKVDGLAQNENRSAVLLDSVIRARVHIGNAWVRTM